MSHAFSSYPGDPPDDGPRFTYYTGPIAVCPMCDHTVRPGDIVDAQLDGTLIACAACTEEEYPGSIAEWIESATQYLESQRRHQ